MENYKAKSLIYFACFIMSAAIGYFVERNYNPQADEAHTELAKVTMTSEQLPAL